MISIAELLSRKISAEEKDHHSPKCLTLSEPLTRGSEKAHGQYETGVFNLLFAKCDTLGIKNVMKFKALLVDGALELVDGRRLAVEIKYRMNWEKACQAEYQFRNFLKRKQRMPFAVNGGLVFFNQFSGDWKKQSHRADFENGWIYWYVNHAEVDDLPLHLLRLQLPEGIIESFPG